jgi:hypothetical protein
MISTSARGSASFASTQARVDLVEDLLRLALDVLVEVLGHDAGQVDGVAVLDGVRQDAARIVAHDAHRLISSRI